LISLTPTHTTEIYTLSLHDALPILGADESLQKDYGFNNPGFAYGDPDDIALSIMSEEEYRAQSFMQQEVEIVNPDPRYPMDPVRSEEHTSELQSRFDLVCRLLLEKK